MKARTALKYCRTIGTKKRLELEDNYYKIKNFYWDLSKDQDHFDLDRLNLDSEIIVILRYFEYLCIAKFTFEYVKPMLQSGLIMKDIFQMMKHCLKNRLLLNVPSFETVFEPDIQYLGKIKYN